MSATKGYYSVIQYCPDRSRMEAANIGVLLLCPEVGFVKARTAAGNDRIRRFFRGQPIDLVRIKAAKRSIERRVEIDRDSLNTPEGLVRFMDTRGNDILLTPPRPMKVSDPQADLEALFRELVGGRARPERREAEIPALDQVFRRPALQSRVLFDHEVLIPVLRRPLRVPYAFRNGVLNLVKPQRFAAEENRATSAAMRLASEGELLHRHPENGEQRKLIVVSVFEPTVVATDLPNRVGSVLGEFHVRVVQENEIDAFAAEVEQQAH